MKTKALISCVATMQLICAFVLHMPEADKHCATRQSHLVSSRLNIHICSCIRKSAYRIHSNALANELRHEKTVFKVLNQFRHKPGYTITEDGYRLEILDLGSRGTMLTM